MKAVEPKLIIIGLLFLLTLASGVWLSRSGKPLNVMIFTLHKLIALATVIITGVTIYQWRTGYGMSPVAIGAIVITGLLFLILFVSGALLSLGKPMPSSLVMMHAITPLLAAAATAGTLYLLAGGRVPA